jgi:hypothetical protein
VKKKGRNRGKDRGGEGRVKRSRKEESERGGRCAHILRIGDTDLLLQEMETAL